MTHSFTNEEVMYCRRLVSESTNKIEFWTNSGSGLQVEFGTKEYPFKRPDMAMREVTNLLDSGLDILQYYARNQTYHLFYGTGPIVAVNLSSYNSTADPTEDPSLPNPQIIIDEPTSYVWP